MMMSIFSIILALLTIGAIITAVILLVKNKGFTVKFDTLEKERKNFESIIEQANDAMFVIDIVDGRIHQANPSAAALLGYTLMELKKLSLFELHPKELLERSSARVADVWEKGGLIYNDLPFITRQGDELPVECSAKVAPFAGRPAIVIYARDIRDRLRMESEIRQKNEIIEQKNKDITDSIEYAKNIQEAILPSRKFFKEFVNDAFILFMPKDIVSGDFYWYRKAGDHFLFAAADCTGHGVPGALMSMIGNGAINEIVNNRKQYKPSDVLNELRDDIIRTISYADPANKRKDGMDIALCNLNIRTNVLQYAGAFNSLWLVRKGLADSALTQTIPLTIHFPELGEIPANKFPVGSYAGFESQKFTNHEIQLEKGDIVYVFTDGYADQFGGSKGKKFKYKKLMELLISINDKTMDEQKELLRNTILEWKGDLEQVDDILIMGVKI